MGRAEGSVRLLREILQLMSIESDRGRSLNRFESTRRPWSRLTLTMSSANWAISFPMSKRYCRSACLMSPGSVRFSLVWERLPTGDSVPDRINPDMSRVVRRLDEICRLDPSLAIPTASQLLAFIG